MSKVRSRKPFCRGAAAAIVVALIGVDAAVCLAADPVEAADAGAPPDAGADAVAPAPDASLAPPEPAPPPPTPTREVVVRSSAPPRSASEARVERNVLEAAPH